MAGGGGGSNLKWGAKESELAMKAYAKVSHDAATGTDQTGASFKAATTKHLIKRASELDTSSGCHIDADVRDR